MNKSNVINGQPGLVLLSSKMRSLKTVSSQYVISVPMSGKFSELYPDFFKLANKNEDTDTFTTVIQKEGSSQVMSIPLIEVMFAAKSYPGLEDNQIFSVSLISFDSKNNILHVVGDVLEIME